MIKNFEFNGGTQWRADYDDGSSALAVVYSSNPARSDVIEAIADVNNSEKGE